MGTSHSLLPQQQSHYEILDNHDNRSISRFLTTTTTRTTRRMCISRCKEGGAHVRYTREILLQLEKEPASMLTPSGLPKVSSFIKMMDSKGRGEAANHGEKKNEATATGGVVKHVENIGSQ